MKKELAENLIANNTLGTIFHEYSEIQPLETIQISRLSHITLNMLRFIPDGSESVINYILKMMCFCYDPYYQEVLIKIISENGVSPSVLDYLLSEHLLEVIQNHFLHMTQNMFLNEALREQDLPYAVGYGCAMYTIAARLFKSERVRKVIDPSSYAAFFSDPIKKIPAEVQNARWHFIACIADEATFPEFLYEEAVQNLNLSSPKVFEEYRVRTLCFLRRSSERNVGMKAQLIDMGLPNLIEYILLTFPNHSYAVEQCCEMIVSFSKEAAGFEAFQEIIWKLYIEMSQHQSRILKAFLAQTFHRLLKMEVPYNYMANYISKSDPSFKYLMLLDEAFIDEP